MLDVGWPEPAEVLHLIESTRNCWASSAMSFMSIVCPRQERMNRAGLVLNMRI